jgi:3-phenylpropionate/cinnamic acid dioxygenase small subunit
MKFYLLIIINVNALIDVRVKLDGEEDKFSRDILLVQSVRLIELDMKRVTKYRYNFFVFFKTSSRTTVFYGGSLFLDPNIENRSMSGWSSKLLSTIYIISVVLWIISFLIY